MRIVVPRRWRAALGPALVALIALASATFNVMAQETAPGRTPTDAQSRALSRASDAVIGLRVIAVEDATSNAALGRMRLGSGVVIGADDLVLTIGYLIIEADQVHVITDDERVVPARVVAYDAATGFGLVQALAPLRLEPVPLGDAAALANDEPLMVASGGESGGVSVARMVSRRPFAGYWEYHIEGALFTSPARTDHSGAGLFNARGELMGIGSLLVLDALGPDGPRMPGNMFVPVDLLKPILSELLAAGTSTASRRAWLGLNCIEQGGQLRVLRVSSDSPADVAGVQVGDSILRIDGTEVHELDKLWKTLWQGGQPEREVVLDIRRGDVTQSLHLHTVDRQSTLKKAQGI
jgi:S1-C subfamily serine protease